MHFFASLLLLAAAAACALAAPVRQADFQAYAVLEPQGAYYLYGLVAVWSDGTDYQFVVSSNMTTLTSAHLHVIADSSEYLQIADVMYERNASLLRFSTPIADLAAAGLVLTDMYVGLHNDFDGVEIEGDLQTVVLGQHYMSYLNGADVAPTPVDTTGGGVGIVIKRAENDFDSHVCWTLEGDVDAAHIHQAQWPSQGSALAQLDGTAALVAANAYAGCQVDVAVGDIFDVSMDIGGYYYNIHSSMALNGELRGQIAYGAQQLICELGADIQDGFCQFPFGFKLNDAAASIKMCTDFNGAGIVQKRSLEARHGGADHSDPCADVYVDASPQCLAALGSYLCTLKCARCDSPFPLNTVCQSQCDDVFAACGATLTADCKAELDFDNRCSPDLDAVCSPPVLSNGQVPPSAAASVEFLLLLLIAALAAVLVL